MCGRGVELSGWLVVVESGQRLGECSRDWCRYRSQGYEPQTFGSHGARTQPPVEDWQLAEDVKVRSFGVMW